jgi:hypothetical protein
MIFFRYILYGLVLYLVIRLLIGVGEGKKDPGIKKDSGSSDTTNGKKISKKIGEYIDYEDVDK